MPYYLYVPYHGAESRLPVAYPDLTAAKAAAHEKAVYGYCVCDQAGKEIYGSSTTYIDALVVVLVAVLNVDAVVALQCAIAEVAIDITLHIDRDAMDTDL